MEDQNTALWRFFNACDELIEGKHILADKKIDDMMRAVAVSEELTGLFGAVLENFDYPAAKRRYLIPPERSPILRGEAYLPSTDEELVAFVFCIFAEIENGTLKTNEFLLRYFYVDGSLTASYERFTATFLRPFRDILRGCFPTSVRRFEGYYQRRNEGVLDALSQKAAEEHARLTGLSLPREDFIAGSTMLTELSFAIDKKDVPAIRALLCGYLYFLQYLNIMDESSGVFIALAGDL